MPWSGYKSQPAPFAMPQNLTSDLHFNRFGSFFAPAMSTGRGDFFEKGAYGQNGEMLWGLAAGFLCFATRRLTLSASIAAAIIGGLFWEAGKWAWTAPLLLFFVTSTLLSHLPSGKARTEIVRNWKQVVSNGGPAAVCAGLFLLNPDSSLACAALASLAAANADTWATEFGTRFGRPCYRLTTLKETMAGRSGGVSTVGLLAGFAGSATIAACAPLLGRTFLIGAISVAGFVGCLFDSLLGDTVQAVYEQPDGEITETPTSKLVRGVRGMTNDMVNLLATSIAAVLGYFVTASWASR